MLGAAVVILIAVPMMSLSNEDSQDDTTATETARETPLDSEPTATITPVLPTGTVQSTLPGLPPTSSAAAPPPAAGGEGTDPATVVDAHSATTGGEGAGNAPQGGTSGGGSGSGQGGGSGSGQGGGGATPTRAPAPAGQPAGAEAGGSSSASSQSSSAQKPAPTSSTPAEPTKTCMLDLLGLCI